MSGKRDDILQAVIRAGSISRQDLARKLCLDVRTVSHYTAILAKQGFIESERNLRPVGRPIREFQPCSGVLNFASILLTHNGIFGAVKNTVGELLTHRHEADFSTMLEIPSTAARKIVRFFAQLEEAAGVRIHAMSLVFLRVERFSTFAAGVYQETCRRLALPIFADAPISAHAYAYRAAHPEYQRILVLHFGFALEYAFLSADKDASEPDVFIDANRMEPQEIESLRHQVSLSNILDHVAALEQRFFYPWFEMLQHLHSEDAEIREILLASENSIQQAIRLLAEKLQPDACVLLALANDLHLTLMPALSSNNLQIRLRKRTVPCFFLQKNETEQLPLLLAACASAEYRAWKHFFKDQLTNRK